MIQNKITALFQTTSICSVAPLIALHILNKPRLQWLGYTHDIPLPMPLITPPETRMYFIATHSHKTLNNSKTEKKTVL